jgi:hypothetical protein
LLTVSRGKEGESIEFDQVLDLLLRYAGLLVEKPIWLGEKAACLVDGSEVLYGGAAKIQSNLYYGVDASTLGMKELHLMDRGGGEKLRWYEQLGPNDVEVGDRIYGTIGGMEQVRGSDIVLRLRAGAFRVRGRRSNGWSRLRGWAKGEAGVLRYTTG